MLVDRLSGDGTAPSRLATGLDMALGGPRVKQESVKGDGSPIHFLRILRFSKAYRRYLVPGLLCVVIVAFTYSLNIAALLPFIQVIADDRGIPTWVHGWIAEERLGVVLDVDDAVKPPIVRVLKVKEDSVARNELKNFDRIVGVDGHDESAREVFLDLANMPDGKPVMLAILRDASAGDNTTAPAVATPATAVAQDVMIAPKPRNTRHRLAFWGAKFLPAEMNKQARMTTLIILVVAVLLIAIVGAVCRFFGEYLIALTAARTVVGMRRMMYRKVLRFPLSQFTRTSDIVSRFVQDSQDIYRGLNYVFAKSLREPLKAAFVFTAALIIDWRITLVAVIAGPMAALIIRKLGKTVRRSNKKLLIGYSRMLSALEGALIGIRVVKGYTMEGYERRNLYALDLHMLKQELKLARIEAFSSPMFETIGRIVASFVIIYFAQMMFDKTMGFGKFAGLAGCLAAMFDPVRQMSGFYNRMQRANAAADRCFDLIDRPVEQEGGRGLRNTLPTIQESIEFRDLTFTYPGAETPALAGVNLIVHRGERVAIVGPNGSGKTTLLSVLMRFFEPDEGALLLDGRDVRDFSIVSLRRQISLVTQDSVIFPDTIASNIAYGDEDLLRRIMLQRRHPRRNYDLARENGRIIHAAEAAHADEFIREKPEGYDTIVGEHGTTLSGGQKQRLAIARAILRDAPIFIFDEATSQVDTESEQQIHDAVERFLKDRTAFIIAHRFSTIMQADRIVVMERGRVIDSGSHDELLKRCPLYRNLAGGQFVETVATTGA